MSRSAIRPAAANWVGRRIVARNLAAAASLPLLLIVLTSCVVNRDDAETPTPERVFQIVTATAVPSPTPRTEMVTYVVEEGDTLIGIAADFEVSQDAIIAANAISDPDSLFVGQELAIPPTDNGTPSA